MNEPVELEYLRELCDTQKIQIETLQENLETERTEVTRLTRLVSMLEALVDQKTAEADRLAHVAQGIYLA